MEPLRLSSPKLTVCVIAYNQAPYIRRCLDSLVSQQTTFDFEIIVGDDMSTDDTRDIIKEYEEGYPTMVRAIFQDHNTGGSRNNLEVHSFARGEYVAHVDGDDYTLPGKLQAQVDLLDRHPECAAVWHRVDYFDDQGGFCPGTTAVLTSFPGGVVTFSDSIRLGFVGVFSSLMYRRAMRTPVALDRQILDLYFTWDLLSKGNGRILDGVYGRYRVASQNSLTRASLRKRTISVDHAWEFLAKFPARRSDFFIWAVSAVAFQVRAGQPRRVLDSLAFAWRARTVVNPNRIWANLIRLRQIQVKWRQQRTFDHS